jgi:hypothetical protein
MGMKSLWVVVAFCSCVLGCAWDLFGGEGDVIRSRVAGDWHWGMSCGMWDARSSVMELT